MKFKPTVLLATFVVALGLLLGASAAQAAPNVIVDENGNVTRIENLPVLDEATGDTIIYNVGFVNAAVTDVYGGGPLSSTLHIQKTMRPFSAR